jgi:glycine cleavage system aminomethyltransferase T
MSLEFLSASSAAERVVARSPMERMAKAAGARFEIRDGWNVAVDYEAAQPQPPVGWADVSHLSKFELQGAGVPGEFGRATRHGDGWVCRLTSTRTLVIAGDTHEDAVDLTCNYAALTVFGPRARETIARFCAIDLRPQISPPGSFRPGSIARQPGMIIVEETDRFLLLFGWAIGEYMWTMVDDAARRLGGGPIGLNALAALAPQEVSASA